MKFNFHTAYTEAGSPWMILYGIYAVYVCVLYIGLFWVLNAIEQFFMHMSSFFSDNSPWNWDPPPWTFVKKDRLSHCKVSIFGTWLADHTSKYSRSFANLFEQACCLRLCGFCRCPWDCCKPMLLQTLETVCRQRFATMANADPWLSNCTNVLSSPEANLLRSHMASWSRLSAYQARQSRHGLRSDLDGRSSGCQWAEGLFDPFWLSRCKWLPIGP